MEEKLGLLVTEKEIADEKNQHLNKTLTKVKESHNHCSKQYDNTCMQLQESEQELKLLKTDFSESIEKLKNEHKQSQTCWEEKKVELCQTIKKKRRYTEKYYWKNSEIFKRIEHLQRKMQRHR